MKTAKRLPLVVAPVLLALVAGAAWAGIKLPPRISWDPNPLTIEAIAPGEVQTRSVVLTNTGSLLIPAKQELRIVATGAITPYVTVVQPAFPKAFKPGQNVTFDVKVSVPEGAQPGVLAGALALQGVLPNNKRINVVWQAEALPVSIQVVAASPANQAVLGPLAGAEVHAYRLSSLIGPIEGPVTANPSLTDPDLAGTFRLSLAGIPDDEWVLVTATGGQDIDADDNGILDASPTANSGTLHALAKASDWRAGALRINVLTEIAWQQVVSAAEAGDTARLDAGLRWAANVLLRQDLGGDGVLAHQDLLQFNPLDPLKDQQLTFPFSQLQTTSTGALSVIPALLAGDDASLATAIAALFGNRLALPVPPELVDTSPRIEMPENRQKLTVADASVRSFLSDTAQVELNGHTVLMAEDAAGKTLLLGYTLPAAGPEATPALQQALAIASQTDPEISPRSTALALVMMIAASGMEVDGKFAIAEALLQHPQFESLVADITAAFQSNAYFLDSLALYPDLVAKIKAIAQELFDAYQAQFVDAAPAPLASLRALAAAEAESKTFCDWLNDFFCRSPWNVDEPWTWYGDASLIDVWNPPFMAASEKDPNLVAFANPAMVLYAAEGFDENGVKQNWGLVKRNSSAIDKTLNSGAAQTLLRLDDTWITPETAHIEFNRYRLPFDIKQELSEQRVVVGFLNLGHAGFSAVGLISSTVKNFGGNVSTMLQDRISLRDEGVLKPVVECVQKRVEPWLAEGGLDFLEVALTLPPNADQEETANAMLDFYKDKGFSFITDTAYDCAIEVGSKFLAPWIFDELDRAWRTAVIELAAQWGNPAGWITTVLKAINDAAPFAVSFLTPSNDMAGYDLEWTGTQLTGATRNDARPNGSGLPGNLLPRAYFSYSQGIGTYIGFDASESVFDFVAGFEWDFGDGTTGSGVTTSHTYAVPGTRTVKLVVTDGSGNKAETTRLVEVRDGRPPQIQSLTCVADPTNPLGVLMDFTLYDEDADLDRLEWYLDANADSPAKTTPIDTIWDAWTSSDTLLYPDDGVQVYAPALMVYDAGGNKAAAVCKPVSAIKVGSYPLNDTGITTCGDTTTNGLPCPVAGFPGQDAESGRDVTHNDPSDGHAGFSFTKLDADGNPLAIQNGTWDEAGSEAAGTKWSCVRDNVTGLVWEIKTYTGGFGLREAFWTYSWYNPDASTNGGFSGFEYGEEYCFDPGRCDTHKYVADVNAQGLCGANDWRLPTQFELLSIVSTDRYNPAIDTAWFPDSAWFGVNTQDGYWSSSPSGYDSAKARGVDFYHGGVLDHYKSEAFHVRLVRGGP